MQTDKEIAATNNQSEQEIHHNTGKPAEEAQGDRQSKKRNAREEQADTPNAHQTKQHKTQHQADLQTARCSALTVLTHNIMGTTTMLPEVAMTTGNKHVDIRVFSETKLTENSQCKKQLEECLPDHKMYHSCKHE